MGREEGYFVTDLDDAKVNGWFYCGDGTLHVPPLIHNSAYAAGFVISRSYQDFTQFVVVGSASTHETTLAAMRSYANGTYGEWEYINPPMLAGVEYRTTERYNGKAVYAAHIKYTCSAEVGNASGFSSLYIPAGLPNSKLVRVEGTVNEKRPFPVMTPSGGMVTIDHFWDSGELSLQFNKASFPEGTSFYFMIYYTKY